MILRHKNIIITGGSMGIGLAVAKECALAGASVILISRHGADLKKAVGELSSSVGQKHEYHALDVGNESEIKKLSSFYGKKKKHIDGLVNCAGIYGPIGTTEEIDLKKFKETITINLLGTLTMCRYFLPVLKKLRHGKIVNFAGGGASGPFPNYSAYAASKIAIVRLTENMALEYLSDHIDINSIAPGFVVTRLHQETIAAGRKAGKDFLKKTQMEMERGGASPALAAQLVVFLLSKDSDGITGKFISAPWDPWQKKNFQERLRKDPDICTMRRIDDQFFSKKQ